MGKRSETDKAIRNIMNWADRPEWIGQQKEVFEAHLTPVCENLGYGQEELARVLDEHGYSGMLFGMMFEDFLSSRFSPDDKNIIDDYLQRRSWRESVGGRHYLQQLRDSILSFYEVVDVSTGQYCDLRDLVRGGSILRVYEHSGTQNMFKWDHIAARVLKLDGKYVFSGGLLPFPQEAARSLLRVLDNARQSFNKEPALAAVDKTLLPDVIDAQLLKDACPAFTSIWLVHTLEKLHAPLPKMVNRDGEALAFTNTRFPFLEEHREDIAQRLDSAREWERDHPDEHRWLWFPEPNAINNNPGHGIAVETFQDGRRPISGTLELTSGALNLTTNSMERVQRSKNVLETLLHGFIGPALTKIQTPEQMMAEHESSPPGDGNRETEDSIDPEIVSEIIQSHLDQHYRQCLDEPIPALDNKTPRQCARSKTGRKKVIDWLKHLENNELRRATSQGQIPYDSRWMWKELELTRYLD